MSDETMTVGVAEAEKQLLAVPDSTDLEELQAVKVYEQKNEHLSQYFEEVSASELYRFIFPPETLERKGDKSYRASNPIFSYCLRKIKDVSGKDKPVFRNEIVFRDTFEQALAVTAGNQMALCSMISFSGRRKTARNGYECHGFIIDLDGVGMNQLVRFWDCVDHNGAIPQPTFVANSGHGLHIYYVFEHPVPLYPQVVDHLQQLKRGLTELVWNRETSTYPPKERQYQGIFQCFRMVGSSTKLGVGSDKGKYIIRAWETGSRVTISYLNRFVDDKYKCPESPDYSAWAWAKDHHTLAECQRLWPDWYQKRIVDKQAAGQYKCNTGLYNWWLRKIQEPRAARDGNRYHCISMLYVYAVKCGIDKSVVDADAEALLGPFNILTEHADNRFTLSDIKSASKFYDPKFAKITRKEISRRTGIQIPVCRRNGRNRAVHMTVMSAVRDALHPAGAWRNRDGAPKKQQIVEAWRVAHPDGKKIDCQKETGLSRPTVLKWWDSCAEALAAAEERRRLEAETERYMKSYYNLNYNNRTDNL